jgi:Zn-dependent M28 family amino/carboxypeptidase
LEFKHPIPLMTDIFRSDHAPFWAAGVPAVMITDTANFRNPHYHRPSDTPDTLDYDFMGNVARTLVATMAQHAGLA